MIQMIDSHIHLDHYTDDEIEEVNSSISTIQSLISVSFNLESAKRNLLLSEKYPKVNPAFGFHPEQPLLTNDERMELLSWIECNQEKMIAVGEVGLPYYLRQESSKPLPLQEYIDQLEVFIVLAKKWNKPIILHAIYEDAPIVCDLLEKHSIQKAHFHWFKGDPVTINRIAANGYCISFTPDIVYEQEIQEIASIFPIEQMMVETDGPWRFEGPFKGLMTHPNMMNESIAILSKIKEMPIQEVYKQLLYNTRKFYSLI
ncbi:TatD DNase family protein [Cytobacillus eiseniae]|uniref:TatD DNase family protein n=1 Tax=Cytobacillus eiseniae TaxID=762947 RepID=A0ABS4RIQ3_9BACI|nr:TatD family hydrolase [Cytobacillus eiseniae]MBP2242787.1 TatD DNase family protein [Cytobacillus eiseniae]